MTLQELRTRATDTQKLALTAYAEARGDGVSGMHAVCCVARTRVLNPRWWGRTWDGVLFAVGQFSCWSVAGGDKNHAHLMRVASELLTDVPKVYQRHPLLHSAMLVATDVMEAMDLWVDGTEEDHFSDDTTDSADHYHARSVDPWWAQKARRLGKAPVASIGRHVFWRLEVRT